MKKALFLILLLLLALFQGAFLPLNLFLLTIPFLFLGASLKTTLWLSFLAGILIDLCLGSLIGFTSLYLLGLVLVLWLLSKRFSLQHPLFLVTIVFLSSLIYSWLVAGIFAFWQAIILASLALLTKFFLSRLRI